MVKTITAKSSGVRRIRSGGLWVYANEINERLSDYENGELVELLGPGGSSLGIGYVEPRSLIAVRMFDSRVRPVDRSFLRARIIAADRARQRFVDGSVYRMVFSEADLLPGLVIDRYGELLTMQCNTWGMERLEPDIIEVLRSSFEPRAIIVRNESELRSGLDLPTDDLELVYDSTVDLSAHRLSIMGLDLAVDFTNAQKTGLYLDQIGTYRTVEGIDFSGLTGADLFCYSGLFGMLALRRGATHVTFVDSSGAALERLSANLEANEFDPSRYDIVRSDVVSYLADRSPEEADFLFVDPPKFIKSRKSYYKGLQGYFNLNRAAVRALCDGGLLFTFSCSHHAGEDIFRKKVLDAIQKEGCRARELFHFRQNADHAVLLPMEESFYLKGFLFGIDRRKEEFDDTMGIS